MLNMVVARLEELAERVDSGATWSMPADGLPAHVVQRFPGGTYNLGLAHGVPGVVALLGKASRASASSPGARRLLDEAITWPMAQRLPAGTGVYFPSYVAPGVLPSSNRSAWCYGDPGVAAALVVAARHADEPLWEDAALLVAWEAAVRPSAECGVLDAGVCHGAAGLAHIFNRLYQATGKAVFQAAALRWVERIFDEYTRANVEPGLLEGAVGVGLVLLALATPLEPRWDRVLLLS
jgi:lantibiotic biosynthesis protein